MEVPYTDVPYTDNMANEDKQPACMSDETFEHFKLVRSRPLYWETRNWHPVLVRFKNVQRAADWLEARGAVRGTREARNDWLFPMHRLFLVRDTDLAIELKLNFA